MNSYTLARKPTDPLTNTNETKQQDISPQTNQLGNQLTTYCNEQRGSEPSNEAAKHGMATCNKNMAHNFHPNQGSAKRASATSAPPAHDHDLQIWWGDPKAQREEAEAKAILNSEKPLNVKDFT